MEINTISGVTNTRSSATSAYNGSIAQKFYAAYVNTVKGARENQDALNKGVKKLNVVAEEVLTATYDEYKSQCDENRKKPKVLSSSLFLNRQPSVDEFGLHGPLEDTVDDIERVHKILQRAAKTAKAMKAENTLSESPSQSEINAYSRRARVAAEAELALAMYESLNRNEKQSLKELGVFFAKLPGKVNASVESPGGSMRQAEIDLALHSEFESMTRKLQTIQ